MIHNLKVWGFVLTSIFAMSAVAASGAFAQEGEATMSVESNVVGTPIAGKANALTAFGETVECPETVYDLYKHKVTPHQKPPKNFKIVTAIPTFKLFCKTGGGLKVTVTRNSCDYTFRIGSTKAAATYGVEANLECSTAGDAIDVEVFLSATNENVKACTIKITPQNGLVGPSLINGTTGGKSDVTIEGTFKNISAEESGLCGSKTTAEAEFHTASTITGVGELGEQTEITISD